MLSSKKYIIYLLLIGSIFLCSCMNKYEIKMIGYYEVYKFLPLDSTQKVDLPILILKEDKTFVLNYNKRIIKGIWETGDYGDWMVIDFKFDNHHVQGIVLGKEFDIIENPLNFDLENLKSFSFKRVKKY